MPEIPASTIEKWDGRQWAPSPFLELGTGHIIRFMVKPEVEYRVACDPYQGKNGEPRIRIEHFVSRPTTKPS